MSSRSVFIGGLVVLISATIATAQLSPLQQPDGAQPAMADLPLPPGDTAPLLRLETGGPRSYVSGLAFSPDGATLYACGWDKAVQVWNRNRDGKYEYSPGATLRVPTGAGLYGGLNGLALSADGQWLATAGQGHARDMSGERNRGWILPAGVLNRTSQFDEGLIYVFNTATRTTRILRGHRGPVQSLVFVQGSRSNPPELVSVAEERVEGSNDLNPRVRLWDVARAAELATLASAPVPEGKEWRPLPDLQGWRPGLAAWSFGPTPKHVRVALAWGDDQFRIWDAQTGQVASSKSNPNTLAVLSLSDGGERLLTGAHADIGIWSIPKTTDGQLGALSRKQYQAAQLESIRAQNLPSAAVLIPTANGGRPLALFAVTRYLPDERAEYRLVLTTVGPPITIVREIDLPWRGEVRSPVLAVTRDGRSVAVAGSDSNSIAIYPTSDLVAGQLQPAQVLESRGLNIREAAFVRSGDRWGVIFNDSPNTSSGQFPQNARVLNFERRRIEPGKGQWRPAVASLDGWSAKIEKPGTLTVERRDQDPLTLQLDDQQVVSTYAFCPASAHCPVPLIAVATHLRGQPLLRLFRGDTGEALRWCVGHTERVRSLSFSGDGRMLLSVAADRTVSIWTVTDLVERTLNLHGRLAGVTVHTKDDHLIVTKSPSSLALRPGDELVSMDRKGEAIGLRTTKDFYQAVLDRRPGESISLNIRRNGQMEMVACDIGQAIDESKPLFSLFVVPGEQPDEWDWIGWHPLGNFDASSDKVERLLGWQFNTGIAEHPAKFAAIGDYRDGFYKRDLLQSLIESQKLIVPDVEEEPQVSLWLRNLDGTPVRVDYEDRPQVESPHVQLVANVTGVSSRRIRQLTASFDEEMPQALQQSSEREWTIDLSESKWKRGLHLIKIRLQTSDREVTKAERIQYRPTAPSIDWTSVWRDEVREESVTVKAAVLPASEPLQVELRVHRAGQAEATVVRTWKTREKLEIAETVHIEPGENQLELVATNATAPDEDRELESSHVSTFVRRSMPVKTPRIIVTEVTAVPEGGEASTLVADGTTHRTIWPKIRLRGRITSEVPLENATLLVGEEQRELTGFKPGQVREFSFDENITLKPGSQHYSIQSAIGDERQAKRLTFVYEPPAPQIASLTISAASQRGLPKQVKAIPNVFYAGYHEPFGTVVAILEGCLDNPYHASVLINEKAVADELVKIDRGQSGRHRLTARIPLEGGTSRIVVRVENDWTRQPVSQVAEVELRRPPEILEVLGDDKLVATTQQLTFRVRSQLPVRSARIVIDDSDDRREFDVTPVKDSPDEWLLKANQFGLGQGDHTVRITATNDEGMTVEPVVHTIRMEKAAAPPPVLTIVAPISTETFSDQSVTVSSSKLQLQYLVNSTAATTLRLQVRGNSEKFEIFNKTVEAEKVAIDGTVATEDLELFDGVNEIEVTADNIGGSSKKQIIKVAYVARTTSVEIVSVGDERPRIRNDGTGYFDRPASKARMKLQGQVRLPERASNGQLAARIWVNSFKLPTVPVAMNDKEPLTGQFETEVVFSRQQGNEIKVELFRAEGRLATEIGSTNTLLMDCASPEREQELYVLLLGNGDIRQMRERARSALMEKALRARPLTKQQAAQEIWESDAFAHIHVHDALNAPPAAVQNRLRELIGKMLRNLKGGSKSGPQSIVMVYFQGQITLTKDDFAFGKLDTDNPLTRAITGRILEENLMRTYGAHLIFLDLQQNSMNLREQDVWPKAPHLGIVVSNWKGADSQPEDSRMSAVLEQVFPQTRVVRDLAQKMDKQYLQAQKKFPDKIETVELLKNLYDLRIGALE